MRRALLALALLLTVGLVATPVALAAKGSPHHEELDGCDHGHTGKPCRPDPQPTHGKDCVKHGKHGGINEDHCASTTTTRPPTTTTTAPGGTSSTTTTTTRAPTTTTTTPGTTVVTGSIATTTTSPTGASPSTTTTVAGPTSTSPTLTSTSGGSSATTSSTTLPRTGTASVLLLCLGGLLLAVGLTFIIVSRLLR